jgi:hypothetical protein
MWEKTHIVAPAPFSSRMKAKGKTHVCFPNRRLFQPGAALQAARATLNLKTPQTAILTAFANSILLAILPIRFRQPTEMTLEQSFFI